MTNDSTPNTQPTVEEALAFVQEQIDKMNTIGPDALALDESFGYILSGAAGAFMLVHAFLSGEVLADLDIDATTQFHYDRVYQDDAVEASSTEA